MRVKSLVFAVDGGLCCVYTTPRSPRQKKTKHLYASTALILEFVERSLLLSGKKSDKFLGDEADLQRGAINEEEWCIVSICINTPQVSTNEQVTPSSL